MGVGVFACDLPASYFFRAVFSLSTWSGIGLPAAQAYSELMIDTSNLRTQDPHFRGNATVKDIVIGMSDGLTVPFALAAGLSAAVRSSFVVLIAGIAELAAGSIAMGLGGYLAGRSDLDHYLAEKAREQRHIQQAPEAE